MVQDWRKVYCPECGQQIFLELIGAWALPSSSSTNGNKGRVYSTRWNIPAHSIGILKGSCSKSNSPYGFVDAFVPNHVLKSERHVSVGTPTIPPEAYIPKEADNTSAPVPIYLKAPLDVQIFVKGLLAFAAEAHFRETPRTDETPHAATTCPSCGAELATDICPSCGHDQRMDYGSTLVNTAKLAGRGLRLIFAVSPLLTADEFTLLKSQITSNISRLNAFGRVDVTEFGNNISWSQVKVFCNPAKFAVVMSQAEETYTNLFYGMFGMIAEASLKTLHKTGFDISEFSLLYRTVPKERPDEFMPLIALKTIGAYIYWRKLYAKSREEDITKFLSDEQEKEMLKSIVQEVADARSVVAQNRDFIINVAQTVGLLKLANTPDEVRRMYGDEVGGKRQLQMKMARLAAEQGGVSFDHYMPLSDGELRAVNEVKDSR